jgi:23S rRNA (uracil1939-C5)-methyltransferase
MTNVNFQKFDLHQDDTCALVGAGFNRMLVDPPRSGAFEVVSQLVPMLRPERLVYISCNPATLARDADVLVNSNGYRLSAAGAIDMFPHTAHVESMAVFELPG